MLTCATVGLDCPEVRELPRTPLKFTFSRCAVSQILPILYLCAPRNLTLTFRMLLLYSLPSNREQSIGAP
jgi:hypothetical protein